MDALLGVVRERGRGWVTAVVLVLGAVFLVIGIAVRTSIRDRDGVPVGGMGLNLAFAHSGLRVESVGDQPEAEFGLGLDSVRGPVWAHAVLGRVRIYVDLTDPQACPT